MTEFILKKKEHIIIDKNEKNLSFFHFCHHQEFDVFKITFKGFLKFEKFETASVKTLF